jgi:hypothetical protein
MTTYRFRPVFSNAYVSGDTHNLSTRVLPAGILLE